MNKMCILDYYVGLCHVTFQSSLKPQIEIFTLFNVNVMMSWPLLTSYIKIKKMKGFFTESI